MSDDYVPTTEEVREAFGLDRQDVDLDGRVTVSYSEAVQAFNAWLANVKAEAWDAAVDALNRHYGDLSGLDRIVLDIDDLNPYRKETP